jgi:hypothetical protein
MEFGRVNIRIRGGHWTPREAEKMARLMVRQVQEGLARRSSQRGGREIERLAPAVRIPRGATGEDAARAAAAEICRALGEN